MTLGGSDSLCFDLHINDDETQVFTRHDGISMLFVGKHFVSLYCNLVAPKGRSGRLGSLV